MIWSLSKDDDGLDAVRESELPNPPAHIGVARGRFAPSAGPQTGVVPLRAARGAGPSSVLVDPSSQVPQVMDFSETSRSRAFEPTMVLKTRKVDQLRAEVENRRVFHHRGKWKVLVSWALAGGAALSLGVYAARAFLTLSPEAVSPAEEWVGLTEPSAGESARVLAEQAKSLGERGARSRGKNAKEVSPSSAALSLEELKASEAPTAVKAEALTLEDLPER